MGPIAMADVKEAVMRKFAVLRHEASPVTVADKVVKKAKGGRGKITLRPSEQMMVDLALLKSLLRKDMNELCLELLADQVAKKLSDVRARVSPGEWDVIVRYAEGLDG
jgi:hypothetical protein